jgi:hypothetical protein
MPAQISIPVTTYLRYMTNIAGSVVIEDAVITPPSKRAGSHRLALIVTESTVPHNKTYVLTFWPFLCKF